MGDRVTNAEIKADLSLVKADLEHIRKTTDEMHVVIHGNGNPKAGLSTRMTILETITDRLEKVVWLVTGATVTAIVAAVFALIRAGA